MAKMAIGTPPRTFNLLIDSGSADFWVGGEGCQDNNGKSCVGQRHTRALKIKIKDTSREIIGFWVTVPAQHSKIFIRPGLLATTPVLSPEHLSKMILKCRAYASRVSILVLPAARAPSSPGNCFLTAACQTS